MVLLLFMGAGCREKSVQVQNNQQQTMVISPLQHCEITRFTKSFVNFYTKQWKISIILIVSFLTSTMWDLSIETIWATYNIRVLRANKKSGAKSFALHGTLTSSDIHA